MNSIDLKKMFAEGLKLFNSKRYEQAFKIFKEILALSPNNINTLVILSQVGDQLRIRVVCLSNFSHSTQKCTFFFPLDDASKESPLLSTRPFEGI